MLFIHWISEYLGMAKAMPFLPVIVLPIAAFVHQHRRRRATVLV
jgi:hypothetical protein